MSRWTRWIVPVLVLVPLTAYGQQRYELKPRFIVGQRWAEQRTNTFEMMTNVKVQQQIAEQNRQQSRETYELEWEVLAMADGQPSAVRVAFGPQCGGEIKQNGQAQTVKFPAAGTTVEARRRPEGGVDIQPASANVPEVVALLENLFEADAGAYPKQPIAVGESWTWDPQSVAEAFGMRDGDEGNVTCTLKSVTPQAGRDVAELSFDVKLKKGEAQQGQGQRIATLTNSTLKGTGKLDIAAGRLIELSLAGELVMDGIVYAADERGEMQPRADLEGVGKMSIESRARLVSGATPPAPTPAPTPTPNGNTCGGDFAGEYSNPEITLVLKPGGDDYEGTLRLGEREFPVRAKANGSSLAGSFQSDGHWFDFSATLAGDTLSLTTGGKTHTLQKKVTPRNPLGGDTPANPLGGGTPVNPLDRAVANDNPTPRPAPTPTPVRTGAAPATMSYSVFRCLDQQGFRDRNGQPLEVFRMLLPQGWRFNGGVTWKINLKSPYELSRVDLVNPAILTFQVCSPDGRVVVQAYPEVHFADLRGSPAYATGAFQTGSDYAGFVVCPVADPVTYITDFVIPRQRGPLANARIVDRKDLPSVAQRYEREDAIVNRALQDAGLGGISHQAAVVTVEYDLDGVPYREAFLVALAYLQTSGVTMWSSRLNISMRAPSAEAERWLPVIATMLNSVEFNMRWVGEYLRLQKRAEGVIIDVDKFCQQVDADIAANRAETNAQIHRDMYPRLAPYCDHTAPDGKRYFLETDQEHQMNADGVIRSGISLPDEDGWTRMPEYTGP